MTTAERAAGMSSGDRVWRRIGVGSETDAAASRSEGLRPVEAWRAGGLLAGTADGAAIGVSAAAALGA